MRQIISATSPVQTSKVSKKFVGDLFHRLFDTQGIQIKMLSSGDSLHLIVHSQQKYSKKKMSPVSAVEGLLYFDELAFLSPFIIKDKVSSS